MKLAEARIVLTGGGAGIGRFLLERLISDGASVAVLERDAEKCAEIATLYQGAVQALTCDVTDAAMVDERLRQLFESGFEPSALINNAGVIHSRPLVNMLAKGDRVHSHDHWRRILAANLDSVFLVTGRVVDRMLSKRTKGVVVSVSSIAARGNAGQSAYSAAKAGVNALTMTWAKELGAMGLRFVAVAPGFIDTPSTNDALSETTITKLKLQVPLRRLGDLESVYQAVRYAIENEYVNGTVLDVDGGLVI
jgi:3-oxoacyl-[acyl-carrier protein] reductase